MSTETSERAAAEQRLRQLMHVSPGTMARMTLPDILETVAGCEAQLATYAEMGLVDAGALER